MTPEHRAKFKALLGDWSTDDRLNWDSLPIEIKRVLTFAAGLPMHSVFTPWACQSEIDRERLNRAAKEFVCWADSAREKLMAAKPEGVAA